MPGMKHGTWSHIEIPTASVEGAKRFYGGLFGWKFTDMPEMKYTVYQTGEGEVGGGLFDPPPGATRQIINYISVDDLDSTAKRVVEVGGRVCSERKEVPGHGWFQVVADPDGNAFALWQWLKKPDPAVAPKKSAPKKAAKKTSARGKKKR